MPTISTLANCPVLTAAWHSPNRQVHNQTDFILTPQHFKSSINLANTRSFPLADIGSNHDLVLTTTELKLKTRCFTKSPHIQVDLEKLKGLKTAGVFLVKIGGKFTALCILKSNVDTLADSLKEELPSVSTAEVVRGRQKKKIKPWVTNEVLDQCDQR